MRKLHCVLIFVFISFLSFSQAPQIQWQRCLGGTGKDYIDDEIIQIYNAEQKPLLVTSDSGYMVGGVVQSNDGDVNGNHGGADLWLVRLDRYGSTIWKKAYGGSGTDLIGNIQETADHGFIIAGSSSSNNGDVSGNHGGLDAWVLRIDGSGNILWQKSLGGTGTDKGYHVKVTPDQGYLIAGLTRSDNGDVSGRHTGSDSTDAWVVKLDEAGTIQWQKCLGGSAYDEAVIADLTSDGGYIIGANTTSNNGDVSGQHGKKDIWIVKLSATGIILWQRCYGGSQLELIGNIRQTSDNGFIIGGVACSSNGDVTAQKDNELFEAGDGWIIKVNADGTPVWNRCYGDLATEDALYDITELSNGDFLASGFSNLSSFSKYGLPAEVLLLQVTSTGSLVWMEAYGSVGGEAGFAIVKSPGDGFLMLGVTSGDNIHSGYPKLHTYVSGSHGTADDLWVVKFGRTNTIKGTVYLDRNLNGNKENDEPLVTGGFVKSLKANIGNLSIPSNGIFINTVDTGTYITTIDYSPYFSSVPASKISNFIAYDKKDSFSFALQPIPGKRDLTTIVVPLSAARPGFDIAYKLIYKNNGTEVITNGEVLFKKDSRLSFLSALPAHSSSSGDTIKWSYNDLKPLDTAAILVYLRVAQPPTVNLNDTLSSLAIITPVTGDLTPADDTAYLNQRVVGSYDPNDKSENLAGKISQREVSGNAYINYLIRFQNTGTDTAFNITIRDTLDDKLDWNTLQMVSASHPYQLNIKFQNQLTWSFNNILLVDSFRNESASHGFIAYRVKPKSSLAIGDVIKNTAAIYFDYNLPVETNTQETEVVQFSINNPQVGIPTISSFTPASAGSGTAITITGTNLSGASAVSFGGTAAASFTANSSTSITAVVGTGASGDVSVTTSGGTATLAGFMFIPAPTIISFTPTSGGTGVSVTITGTNLTGATAVSFGGTAAASFTVNSATTITAVVGAGASGDVSITTPGGIATLAGFTFIPAPTITSFTPASGGTAASITITGTNFTGATEVSFGGTAATSFTINSATSITAVVGTGASGNVSVTTPGGTAILAGFTFTVVTAIDPVPANSLGIRFYPNPTTGSFVIDTLKLSDKWETLEIFDTQGKQKLSNFNIRNKTRVIVNVEYLSKGLYMAILKRKNGPATVVKILKL
ncbi:MAG: T9SS type A sorting domain-containing protein [Chitinophagaceae bacterium]